MSIRGIEMAELGELDRTMLGLAFLVVGSSRWVLSR